MTRLAKVSAILEGYSSSDSPPILNLGEDIAMCHTATNLLPCTYRKSSLCQVDFIELVVPFKNPGLCTKLAEGQLLRHIS